MNRLLPLPIIALCCWLGWGAELAAQPDTLSTYPATAVTSGGGGVSFEFTTNKKITVHRLETALRYSGSNEITIYYRPGGVQSAAGIAPVIDAANGWVPLNKTNAIAPSAGALVILPPDLDLHLMPGTYGFFIDARNDVGYQTWNSGVIDVFSDGVVSISTGQNKGYGGSAPAPASHPRQFAGSVIYSVLPDIPDNAGVASVDSPACFCPGQQQVVVTLENLGNNKIDSVMVHWKVDGVQQNSYSMNQSIDTLGSPAGNKSQIILGTIYFQQDQRRSLEVWTATPNGMTDAYSTNDSIVKNLRTGLAGYYPVTTGISTSKLAFKTISSALSSLDESGVCGPTVFNVKQGEYNEQLTIGYYQGSSAENPVVFRADPANTLPVEIKYTGTPDANYVVRLKHAGHVSVENLTILASGIFSTAVLIEDSAHHNNFIQCRLSAPSTTLTGTERAVIYANSSGLSHIVFENNHIYGGSYGLYFRGGSTSELNEGLVIRGNEIEDAYHMGIYLRYTDGAVVDRNLIFSGSAFTEGYGIYSYYGDNGHRITGNVIKSPGVWPQYALRLNNADGTQANRGLVANNMFHSGNIAMSNTVHGIYIFDCYFLDILHNNVVVEGTSANSRAAYFSRGDEIKAYNNNFLHYGNGYAIFADPAVDYDFDYNNLASSGPYLGKYDSNAVDLTAWKLMNQDKHSVEIDSVFTDLDSLRTCHTGLYKQGRWMGYPLYDFDGEQRNQLTPDIGADEFTLDPNSLDIGDTAYYCNGSPLILSGNIKYGIFNWSTGSREPQTTVNTEGKYHLDVEACVVMTDSVEVIDIYPVAAFEIDYQKGELIAGFLNQSENGRSFLWEFGDGETSAEPSTWHRYAKPGTYLVRLTSMNECDTVFMEKEIVVINTGVIEVESNTRLRVYPNPATDRISLRYFGEKSGMVLLKCFDMNGRVEYSQPCFLNNGVVREIDVTSLPKGMHILQLILEDEVLIQAFVVQ